MSLREGKAPDPGRIVTDGTVMVQIIHQAVHYPARSIHKVVAGRKIKEYL
jgi:hypothetical protein